MQKLEADGFAPLFAYEEAIGFANGSTIRDKDGVRPFPRVVEQPSVED